MIRKTLNAAVLSLLASLVLGFACAEGWAGEGRMPLRAQKVKEGDWVFYRENDEYVKETATGTEKLEDDFIVHYTMETFSPTGEVTQREEVARFLSGERAELAELAQEKGAKLERRKTKIDGKNLTVFAIVIPGDVPYEMWYSDDVGITGRVAMVMQLPSETEEDKMEEFKPIETLAFGNAKTPFDFKKYVK